MTMGPSARKLLYKIYCDKYSFNVYIYIYVCVCVYRPTYVCLCEFLDGA